jgi:signal transduction histidine kinase
VFEERVRIARELHDVVAHHVSVMGVQAGAARRVVDSEPAKAVQALSSIEASSRQAVAELHRLLGFLRQEHEADGLASQPTLRRVGELAREAASSDLEVVIAIEGEPGAVPPTIDLSAYRLVQEALTNTRKHAHATRAAVTVRYRPDELEVEVVDDGTAAANSNGSRSAQGGHGLIGMRERVGLHGGQLSVGPRPTGGFGVRATFPLGSP